MNIEEFNLKSIHLNNRKFHVLLPALREFKSVHTIIFQNMGLHTFYGKGPHPLLWAGSPTTRTKITINGIPNSKLL
jgi:hypothetical protein